jgi:hypothetical protein
MEKKTYNPAGPPPSDPEQCEARHVRGTVFQCLERYGARCPYAQLFGMGIYCGHPARDKKLQDRARLILK